MSVEKLPTTVSVEMTFYEWAVVLMAMNETQTRLREFDKNCMFEAAWKPTNNDLGHVIGKILSAMRKAELEVEIKAAEEFTKARKGENV